MAAKRLSEFVGRLRAIRQASPFNLEMTLADAVSAKIAASIGGSARPVAEQNIHPQVAADIQRLADLYADLSKHWAMFESVNKVAEGKLLDWRPAQQQAQAALIYMLLVPPVAFLFPYMATESPTDTHITLSIGGFFFTLLITGWWWATTRKRSRRADAQRRVEASLGPDAEAALQSLERIWADSRDPMLAFAQKLQALIDHTQNLTPVRKALAQDRVVDAEAALVSAQYQLSLARTQFAEAQAKLISASSAEDRRSAQMRFNQSAKWIQSKEHDVAKSEAALRIARAQFDDI